MNYTEITESGVTHKVPSAQVSGKTVIVNGGWLKIATIHDEDWQQGDILPPDQFVSGIRQCRVLKADLFVFTQKPTDPDPRYPYFHEWESVAAIRTASFSDWWDKKVSGYLRRDVRKAAKAGVVVRSVPFDDELVRGIQGIYDETPIRQGGPFWHYKKEFAAVKSENASYADRSEFLGAFWGGELIGFIKIVYVDQFARLMQILSKEGHRDKFPNNALIAKAVEICEARGCSLLTYGRYRYWQGVDPLTQFKHRNGFEEILVPKYYVPLTLKGRLALQLRLYRGAKALLPASILKYLKQVRTALYRRTLVAHKAA